MEGMVDLFSKFVKGGNGKRINPIFYVSNSPWNIYDLLTKFLDIQNLPEGPVLLRDYGLEYIRKRANSRGHKLDTISDILRTYPELPFIMLGDTASKDADYYTL